jgi:glycosyltransferase involved in cell wall biosynthesis
MKILFFIHSMRSGGAERVTATLANYWATLGYEVTILTLVPEKFDFYELHPGIQRISRDLASEGGSAFTGIWNNLRRIRALRSVLIQVKPDVAVAMMNRANVLLAFAANGLAGLVAIGSEHTNPALVEPGRMWRFLQRWSYGKLAAVTALTEESKIWLQSNTRAHRVVVIPNGIEWPLPVQAPILAPESVDMKGRQVLLAVGRLDIVKGFDHLIEAFATLSGSFPDWILVILGEGPQRKRLEEQISQRRLNRQAFLPGVAGNIAEWYSCADLYVSTSRFEGFGNTLVEALAHALPVVSFDCDTGPRHIIRHGTDGFLVPTGDLSALTSALATLMKDTAMRHAFARRAVEARERFSVSRVAGMWTALFADLRSKRKEIGVQWTG